MALIPVEPGVLATVVTSLEMRERPRLRPSPVPAGAPAIRLERWRSPSPAAYRALFRRIGARWLWFSRLLLSDEALLAIVGDPAVEVHAVVDLVGVEVGMVELDRRGRSDTCELSYFGLAPELTGRGLGAALMAAAMARAWTGGVERVTVNTCTLDHPAALGFYVRSGFVAVARTMETFPDPRLSGVLPRDAAPQIPLLDQAASSRAAT